MSEWISVEKKTPPGATRVLVFNEKCISIAEYDPEWFPKEPWIFDELCIEPFPPTHWMPLPEFPKE